jgi:hypothetical protein
VLVVVVQALMLAVLLEVVVLVVVETEQVTMALRAETEL